jgi:hypothetical protein
MGEGMASTLDTSVIWEDAAECAYDADRSAELAAEEQREYEAQNADDEESEDESNA